MLQNTKELYGNKLAALDGEVGRVKDFYFDDRTGAVRYLVADTGSWLTGRLVLLSPHAFGKLDQYENTLHIKLTKKQIENSPPVDSHRPVSRQYEIEYYRYYGWPAYWPEDQTWGMGSHLVIVPPPPDPAARQSRPSVAGRHLQSAQALTGYAIQTVDGAIGQVTGLKVDDRSWTIRDLVVETGHWYAGKQILISTVKVERISYDESKVYVNLTKADIQQTVENGVARAGGDSHGMEKLIG
jgi:sporulation protein YlmC with PRC-barrel domain